MKQLPIYNLLDLSTAHIKKETDNFLRGQVEEDFPEVIVYLKTCGYFILVPDDDIDDLEIPNDLKDCLKFAKENNCVWLVLDDGAEVVDDLKQYEW